MRGTSRRRDQWGGGAGWLYWHTEEDRNRESKEKREAEEWECFQALSLEGFPCNATTYPSSWRSEPREAAALLATRSSRGKKKVEPIPALQGMPGRASTSRRRGENGPPGIWNNRDQHSRRQRLAIRCGNKLPRSLRISARWWDTWITPREMNILSTCFCEAAAGGIQPTGPSSLFHQRCCEAEISRKSCVDWMQRDTSGLSIHYLDSKSRFPVPPPRRSMLV